MTIAVDFDGTLCSWHPGAYELAQPLPERIERVRRMKEAGHTIWIYTARGASLGSEAAADARWGDLTRGQLTTWGIPFDKLIIGKPPYDVIIDDRAVNFTEDWEAQLANNHRVVQERQAAL